jgi:tRNA(adenine34) deaminase
MCFSATILSGIETIVFAYEDVMGGGTGCDRSGLTPLYRNHRLAIIPHVCRNQSLALFKAYFSNTKNIYWKESLLSRHALAQ